MLYEVITVGMEPGCIDDGEFGNELGKFLPRRLDEHVAGEHAVPGLSRITSYNVCYTKLLRIVFIRRINVGSR